MQECVVETLPQKSGHRCFDHVSMMELSESDCICLCAWLLRPYLVAPEFWPIGVMHKRMLFTYLFSFSENHHRVLEFMFRVSRSHGEFDGEKKFYYFHKRFSSSCFVLFFLRRIPYFLGSCFIVPFVGIDESDFLDGGKSPILLMCPHIFVYVQPLELLSNCSSVDRAVDFISNIRRQFSRIEGASLIFADPPRVHLFVEGLESTLSRKSSRSALSCEMSLKSLGLYTLVLPTHLPTFFSFPIAIFSFSSIKSTLQLNSKFSFSC